ncbi:MAG TPA: type II toxin-antitoxin system HicA family toxin [Pyrinomonadaceae bacterium]|jgi:predicted RNA binding protein YcfA (HicA-like mRNA interferase family)
MSKLPHLKPRVVVRALERAGFELRKSKSSHRTYIKDTLRVTVPYHATDIKPGTLRSIIEQAGMTIEEFLSYL